MLADHNFFSTHLFANNFFSEGFYSTNVRVYMVKGEMGENGKRGRLLVA